MDDDDRDTVGGPAGGVPRFWGETSGLGKAAARVGTCQPVGSDGGDRVRRRQFCDVTIHQHQGRIWPVLECWTWTVWTPCDAQMREPTAATLLV